MKSVVTGITGKIGSGKTTLLSIFEKSDFLVIDCDIFARTMIDNNKSILHTLRKTFGNSIFTPENTLDRSELRQIVFNKKEELERLNRITHPYLFSELDMFLRYIRNIKKNIVFEAAVMFEAGLNKLADNLIWIESDIDIILKRVSTRDNEKTETIK
jgi:dephospho-CoA kinase